MSKGTMPTRSEIPVEQTWNLEGIYATPADWEKAYEQVDADLPKLSAFQGRLVEGADTLLEYFQASEKIYRELSKIMVYGFLSAATDTSDQEAAARAGQASGLMARANAANAFANPEIMVIGFPRIREWMQVNSKLKIISHYLERLENNRPHVRSGEIEEMMAMAGDPLGASQSAYGMLTNADMKFAPAVGADGTEHEVGQSTIDGLSSHTDREIRRTTYENYGDTYLSFKNTIAATLTGGVKKDVFYSRAREHETALHASLSPNKIPVEVFHNLLDVFQQNLPTWHRYWRIRKKAMGLNKIHWYDTRTPLSKNPPVVPYEQAVEWICEGMKPLGPEYVEVMRRGCLEDRWVDRSINRGKRSGAFSSGSHDTNPFIMMSYADNIFSLSTLAHELGHSMHSYYARQTQHFLYSGYSLFVAEVASNFNQALTREFLFDMNDDRDFQLTLLDEAMSNFRRYFFIMPTLARFELEMHDRVEKGKPTNADSLNKLCADLFKEGYGDEIEFDYERTGITWAQFGHMYANYYVYQYATGISAAQALAEGVLASQDNARTYLDFLRAGGSAYPLDALKKAGVDMSSREPVEKAFAMLGDMVDRLEGLVG